MANSGPYALSPGDDAVAGELEAEELGCAQLEVSNWTPERVEPGAELRRHLGIDVPRLGPEAPAATGRQLARRDLADEVLGREAEPHEEVGRVLVCKVDPLVVEVGADAIADREGHAHKARSMRSKLGDRSR